MKKTQNPQKIKKKTYQFGLFAERIAVIFLMLKGYKILQRRYKNYFGEIDIIAKRFNNLAFIEVKARKKIINYEEVLSERQIRRIKDSAQFFIAKNPSLQNCNFCFDFIEVRGLFCLKHHINFLS